MGRLPLLRLFSLFRQIGCKMHKTFYHEGHEVIKIMVLLLPNLFFMSFMVNLLFRLRWA